MKLVVAEPESGALLAAVSGRRLVSSAVVLTELPRAVWRSGVDPDDPGLRSTLDRVALVQPSRALLRSAGGLGPPQLRTLDAIHIASALLVRAALDGVLAYDQRLLDAARHHGLPVEAPGVTD